MQRAISVVFVMLGVLAAGCGAVGKKETVTQQPAAVQPEMEAFNQGLALTRQERHAEAEPFYRQALATNPNSADALNNLGWSLAKQGKYAEAIPLFEKALQVSPDYQLARNNLAWARTQLDEQNKAGTKAPGRN